MVFDQILNLIINLRVAITVRVIYINSYDHVSPGTEDFDHVECERFEIQARTNQYRE